MLKSFFLSSCLIVFGVVVSGLLSVGHAQTGQIWYVSPTGNDSNSGSEGSPFATIQRAANVVNPGDTVIVENGVYTGTGVGTPCASSTERPIVCLSRGGAVGAPVTFRARSRHGARLDGQYNTSTSAFRFRSTANYVRIEGFEIFGLGSATNGVSGIQMYAGGHDSEIVDNDIHDIGKLCADHIYGMSAIFVQQPRVLIRNNTIRDIGRYASGENGCSPSTTNYQNHDHGIYVNGGSDSSAPGASDIMVENNIFSNVSRGWAIQVYPGSVTKLSVLNNTFAGANPYRTGHIIVAASTTGLEITNNIFYKPTTAAINFNAGSHSGMTVINNLSTTKIANATPSGVLFASNMESTDPQFATTEFHLQATSPAVDVALTLDAVTSDIDGIARPQGRAADVGAREVPVAGSGGGGGGGGGGGDTTPPPPPTTDTVPPSVKITSPADGSSVRRSITISASAVDDGGVASVTFYVDGSVIGTDTQAPYSASWNFKRAASGAHVLTAIATDTAGNAASAEITVIR